jgi:hypothetical protein
MYDFLYQLLDMGRMYCLYVMSTVGCLAWVFVMTHMLRGISAAKNDPDYWIMKGDQYREMGFRIMAAKNRKGPGDAEPK